MQRGLRVGCVVALLVSSAAWAGDDELTPEKVGKIQFEEKQALDKVQKEFGDKKPSELSQSERRELISRQAEEVRKVHETAGVSEKDYARYSARMNADDRETVKASEKAAEREALKKELKNPQGTPESPIVVPYDEAFEQSKRQAAPPAGRAPPERKLRARSQRSGKHRWY